MILEPSEGKVLIRKSDGLVRETKFKLGRRETVDSYYEGIGCNINGEVIGIEEPNDYADLITKLIRSRYSLDLEIALINNYNLDMSKYSLEYLAYQDFRLNVKQFAKSYEYVQ